VRDTSAQSVAKAYNLDLGALSAVAEGRPTFGEIIEPYTGFPDGAFSANCAFRDVGFLS
jgi:hypothetical protein